MICPLPNAGNPIGGASSGETGSCCCTLAIARSRPMGAESSKLPAISIAHCSAATPPFKHVDIDQMEGNMNERMDMGTPVEDAGGVTGHAQSLIQNTHHPPANYTVTLAVLHSPERQESHKAITLWEKRVVILCLEQRLGPPSSIARRRGDGS